MERKETIAKPWLFGIWKWENGLLLALHPDGRYGVSFSDAGFGWKLSRHATMPGAFVLEYGRERLLIRNEYGKGEMELLDDDGAVQETLKQVWRFEGALHDGKPQGTWKFARVEDDDLGNPIVYVEYRAGEPVDLHESDGKRDLRWLNLMREDLKLPALTERDFPTNTR
jgi:hypothetical protein